jgi:hypothetical protein
MVALNARSVFGHAVASFEGIRASVNVPRPASVLQMASLYVRDMVFDEPIVTSDGVALGGHHTLTVRRDGSYRYQGFLQATGFPSFEVALLTSLGYPVPVPGSPTPAIAQVAFTAHGRVHGSNEPGDQEHQWDIPGKLLLLAAEWGGCVKAALTTILSSTPIFSVRLATWSVFLDRS